MLGREPRARVLVLRAPHDTTRFDAPLRAYRCSRGGVLIFGVNGGNGVVVWLRSPDSIAPGPWPLLQRGDTVSARGAVVAVRFMAGEVAHGAALDSGVVRVSRVGGTGGAVAVLAHGGGLEAVLAQRLAFEATFDAVAVGADTTSCQSRL
ncbi:MAG TPA: hypothetical protein VM736_15055 [Gemmatimonadales bacterium]|nr:hypothetical protein [Gemmatimonadales bacterium]